MHFIKQFEQDVVAAAKARTMGHRLVFGYLGMPGIGKTQGVHQVADKLGYEVWSGFNIAAASPMDVAIKMPDMEEGCFTTLPNDDFPWEHVVGDRKIILFIDEVTNGTSDTIKAIQRLVNEGCLGHFKLGKNVVTVLAGNRQSDKAGSGTLSTAMYNRVTWRNLVWETSDSDAAVSYLAKKYAPETVEGKEIMSLIQGYFAFKPILEKDFTDARDKLGKEPYVQWCSPRSLEALICRISCSDWVLPGIQDMAGDVGMGRATELNGFATLLGKLDKYEKVLSDPDKAKIPESIEAQYAMLAMLSSRVDKGDFDKVWEYVSRFKEVTMRVVFARMASLNNPDIKSSKAWVNLYKTDKELVSVIAAV